MSFVANLYNKAFKKVSTLDALIKIIDSLKKGLCGDLLKEAGSNSDSKSLVSDLSKSEFLACLCDYIRDIDDKEPTDDKATEEIIKKLVDVVSDGKNGDTLRAQQEFYDFYKGECQSKGIDLRGLFMRVPTDIKIIEASQDEQNHDELYNVMNKVLDVLSKMGFSTSGLTKPKSILSSDNIVDLETLRDCLKNNNHVDGMNAEKLRRIASLLQGRHYDGEVNRYKMWRGPAFDPSGYTDDNGNMIMPEFTAGNLESKAAEVFTARVKELENKGRELSNAVLNSPEYKAKLDIAAWEKKLKETEESLNSLIAKNDGPHLKIFYDQLLVMYDPITANDDVFGNSHKIPREPAEVKANVIQNLKNGKWKKMKLSSWAAALPKEVVVEYSELRAQAEDFARKIYAAKENPFKFLSEKVYNDLIETSPISEEEAKAWVKTVNFTGPAFDKSMKDEIKQELARLYRLAGDDLPALTVSRTKTRSNQSGQTIHLGKTYGDSIKSVLWHEFGHFVDDNTAAAVQTLGHFVWLNSEKEYDRKNAKLVKAIYDEKGEDGFKVKGMNPYAAKCYARHYPGYSTADKKRYPRTSGGAFAADEVLSMALGSSQDDMGRSADSSPDMARKHLDIVAGLLKERQERTMKERETAAGKGTEETRAAS